MYDPKHWNWGAGFCELHRGQELPCQRCIVENHPDLIVPALKEPETVPLIDDAGKEIGFTVRGAVSGRMSSGQPNPAPDNVPKPEKRVFRSVRTVTGDGTVNMGPLQEITNPCVEIETGILNGRWHCATCKTGRTEALVHDGKTSNPMCRVCFSTMSGTAKGLSPEQMTELRRRADASMREVSKGIDLALFEKVLAAYGDPRTEAERKYDELYQAKDRLERRNPTFPAGDKLDETRSYRAASFRTMTGQLMEVPVDPNDFYAGMTIQIAQERKYTFEQFQANRRDLRVAAKNRMFGNLYSDSFLIELQAGYEIQDETSIFKRKDIDALRRMNDKVLIGSMVELPIGNVLCRTPPRLSSSESEVIESIARNGCDPIKVRQLNAFDFEVIDGARRWNAAHALGWQTIKCIVLQEGAVRLRTVKPTGPPARLMTGVTEGIEPSLMTDYIRRRAKSPDLMQRYGILDYRSVRPRGERISKSYSDRVFDLVKNWGPATDPVSLDVWEPYLAEWEKEGTHPQVAAGMIESRVSFMTAVFKLLRSKGMTELTLGGYGAGILRLFQENFTVEATADAIYLKAFQASPQ